MTYRAYLRTHDGQVSEKTITQDRAAAAQAFASLTARADLDGQKMAAALTYKHSQLAFHRFDRRPGDRDYWRGRLDEIVWPAGQVGRPPEMEGGRVIKVYLDTESIASTLEVFCSNAAEINKARAGLDSWFDRTGAFVGASK